MFGCTESREIIPVTIITMEVDHSKRAFIPTVFEIAMLTLISILALALVNLLPALRAGQVENYSLYGGYLGDFIENLIAPIENQQTSNIIVIGFWATVGLISYIVVWAVINVIHAYKNDIPPSKAKGFIMPRNSEQKDIWYSSLGRVLIRVLASLGLLYWLYLLLGSIFPFASSNFLLAVTELPRMWPVAVLSSIVLLVISLYVMIILARCIFLRERVFQS